PYAARSPVNGSTSPIRSVNEHFFAAGADVPAGATDTATTPAATAVTASAATLLLLTTPPSVGSRNTDRSILPGQEHYARPDGRDAALRHPRHGRADRGALGVRP